MLGAIDFLGSFRNRDAGSLGDSISSFYDNTPPVESFTNRGFPYWAAFLSKQRLRLRGEACHAVSGQGTAHVLSTQLPAFLALRPTPGFVFLHIGVNDGPTYGLTAQQTIDNYKLIMERLSAAGVVPIVIPIMGQSAASAAFNRRYARINRWLREHCYSRPDVILADMNDVIVDPTTGFPKLSLSDGLHPKVNGHFQMGKAIAAILEKYLPDPMAALSHPYMLYDATEHPYGSLLPNPYMTGTGGTLSGGATGTVATNWQLGISNAPGATAAGSKVTLADGTVAQRITIGGTSTPVDVAHSPIITLTATGIDATRFIAGETYEIYGPRFEANAMTGIAGLYSNLQVNVDSGSGAVAYIVNTGSPGNAATEPIPSEAFSGVDRTQRMTLPTGTITAVSSALWVWLEDQGTTGVPVSAQIDVTGFDVRRVVPS